MTYRNFASILFGFAASLVSVAQSEGSFSDVTVDDVLAASVSDMPAKWTYTDCVDWAISHNPDILSSLISILQSEQDIASAKDQWLPSVSFSTTHGFTNYAFPASDRVVNNNAYSSSYGINASWTVWEGNARKYRIESSRLMRQQQELSGMDLVVSLRISILEAYLNILYSYEAIEIARQTFEVSSAQAERTAKLVEAGRTSRVDLAQIESQREQDRYNLVQAESTLASYKMTLKKLLALGLDAEIEIDRTAFPDSEVNAILPPMDTTYTSALAWLPQFRSNELSRDIYANDVKVARAGYFPSISLQGSVGTGYTSGLAGWGYQMGHGLNEYVGLSLSVPVFDANKNRRAVAKAKIAELEYDVTRDRLRNELSQTIENLYIQSRNSRARFESGVSRLEATELTATLVDRQFELGLVNPLELLTAHNNLVSARLEQLQNKYLAILSNKTIEFYNTQEVTIP